jgi:hypothetical protein
MAILAVVLGTIVGLRSSWNDEPQDTTEVAGNVIEREPSEVPTTSAPDPDPIVIPLPAEPDEPEPDPEPLVVDPTEDQAEEPAPAPAPTVGIVRDTPPPAPAQDSGNDGTQDSAGDDEEAEPRRPRSESTEPTRPSPSPEPPTSPAPASPSPDPSPSPEDVALRTGEGHSRDTAIAEEGGWLFREVSGHGSQGPDDSREAQARLVVAFNDEAKQGEGAVRSFQCRAWVTAGEGRLTTDDQNHVFEVALLALDTNGAVTETVTAAIERHAYDLAAGETTEATPIATTPIELDASDGVDYTCGVRYRDR